MGRRIGQHVIANRGQRRRHGFRALLAGDHGIDILGADQLTRYNQQTLDQRLTLGFGIGERLRSTMARQPMPRRIT